MLITELIAFPSSKGTDYQRSSLRLETSSCLTKSVPFFYRLASHYLQRQSRTGSNACLKTSQLRVLYSTDFKPYQLIHNYVGINYQCSSPQLSFPRLIIRSIISCHIGLISSTYSSKYAGMTSRQLLVTLGKLHIIKFAIYITGGPQKLTCV